jgi:hypothetical protein
MRGAIPPLPNTPSWRGAQLKAQEQVYFLLLPMYIKFSKWTLPLGFTTKIWHEFPICSICATCHYLITIISKGYYVE